MMEIGIIWQSRIQSVILKWFISHKFVFLLQPASLVEFFREVDESLRGGYDGDMMFSVFSRTES